MGSITTMNVDRINEQTEDLPVMKWEKRAVLSLLISIALFTSLGCDRRTPIEHAEESSDELTREVGGVVEEPDRARQATTVINEFVEVTRVHIQREIEFQRRLVALNASYAATREQFDEVLEERRAERDRILALLIRYRAHLLEATTPEEWARLQDHRIETIVSLAEALHATQAVAVIESSEGIEPEDISDTSVDDLFSTLGRVYGRVAIAGLTAGEEFNPFEGIDERTNELVTDPARNEPAVQAATRIIELYNETRALRESRLEAYEELMSTRATTDDSFTETAEVYDREHNTRRDQILDLLFQLREIFTRQEWEAIFPSS